MGMNLIIILLNEWTVQCTQITRIYKSFGAPKSHGQKSRL